MSDSNENADLEMKIILKMPGDPEPIVVGYDGPVSPEQCRDVITNVCQQFESTVNLRAFHALQNADKKGPSE